MPSPITLTCRLCAVAYFNTIHLKSCLWPSAEFQSSILSVSTQILIQCTLVVVVQGFPTFVVVVGVQAANVIVVP